MIHHEQVREKKNGIRLPSVTARPYRRGGRRRYIPSCKTVSLEGKSPVPDCPERDLSYLVTGRQENAAVLAVFPGSVSGPGLFLPKQPPEDLPRA